MINYNNDPYWDDFNPDKNFHRILFKPGVAVQARELTQAQTILQNQITNSIFQFDWDFVFGWPQWRILRNIVSY